MTAPLVQALSFIEGETLSGYVSRNAKLHETTPRDFCSDLGMRWPFLCSGYDDQIEQLAWLTGEPLNMLRNWRTQKVGIGRYKVGQAIASTGVLRRTAVRLCPKCVSSALSEHGPHGVFQFLEWSVLCIERCTQHGCPLIILPSEGHSHATYDFVSRVLEYQDEIARAAESSEVLLETSFENYVRQRIWFGPIDDWLQDFDLTLVHRASMSLGAALCGIREKHLKHIPDAEMRNFCQVGFERLVGGPDAYDKALRDLHRQSTADGPSYTIDMGPHYHWLREVQAEPAINELIDVTRKFVFETYPTPSGKKVFGQSPERRVWLTMDEARKRTGCGVVFLKKLLGHLDGSSEAEALKRTEVHVKDVPRVRDYMNRLINLKDAASQLGILPQQVKGLQNRGVLGTVKITSSLRYLSREEIAELITQLENLPETLVGRSVAPLKEFCRAKGIPLTRVIDLWRRGELDGKICRGNGKGLQAIEVDWDALCDKMKVQLDQDLTLPETASYLKISVISIRHLRDHGYLTQIQRRNPDTNHLKSYLSQSSIQEFERNYITLGQMASRQKVASIHLARQLDRDDIHPIICGKEQVRVYDRKSVGWGESCNV